MALEERVDHVECELLVARPAMALVHAVAEMDVIQAANLRAVAPSSTFRTAFQLGAVIHRQHGCVVEVEQLELVIADDHEEVDLSRCHLRLEPSKRARDLLALALESLRGGVLGVAVAGCLLEFLECHRLARRVDQERRVVVELGDLKPRRHFRYDHRSVRHPDTHR